jgi:hypothetical protein
MQRATGAEKALQPTPCGSLAKLAKVDADGVPIIFDSGVDRLKRKLVVWVPHGAGPAELARPLTPEERQAIAARAAALELALAPHSENEHKRVELALAAMLGGFRQMRQQDEDVRTTVHIIRAVLRGFPAWAIERAALKIAQHQTDIDPRYPPNDAQIVDVVTGVVRPYRENLRQAEALLDAPVDAPLDRGPSGRLAPIRPWPEKPPQRPQAEPITKSRREALMADLAARKARNDARLDVRADPAEDATHNLDL